MNFFYFTPHFNAPYETVLQANTNTGLQLKVLTATFTACIVFLPDGSREGHPDHADAGPGLGVSPVCDQLLPPPRPEGDQGVPCRHGRPLVLQEREREAEPEVGPQVVVQMLQILVLYLLSIIDQQTKNTACLSTGGRLLSL